MTARQIQRNKRKGTRTRAICVSAAAVARPGFVLALSCLLLVSTMKAGQAQTPPAAPNPAVSTPATASPVPAVIPLIDEKGQRLDVPSVMGFGGAAATALTGTGIGALETLRGNGTRNGYVLTHTGILPTSLSVHAGGRRLLPGQDYWLDGAGGTLFFADPVRAGDSISVSYRYVDNPASQPAAHAAGLLLNLSENTHLNMLYGLNARQEGGLNLSLNGLSLDSRFGQGSRSRYTGLAYFGDVQRNTGASLSWRDVLNDPQKTKSSPAQALLGSGHLLAQNLAVQQGGMRLSADFQDINKQFAGFAELKKGAASDKDALAQLTQLEKERGLQRIGFGLGFGGSLTGKAPAGLSFEWGQVQDRSALDDLKLHPTTEAEKAKAGAASSVLPSLRRESLGLDAGAFSLSLSHRAIDPGFKRLGDLSDADKNAFVLDIRRQFDPTLKVEQVTQADRDQAARTAGLSPDVTLGRMQLGKTGTITFGQYSVGEAAKSAAPPAGQTALASAPVRLSGLLGGQENRGIARQMLAFNNAHLQFSVSTQAILSGYTHLGDLSDAEKTRFGKETGLKRDQMSLLWQPDKTTKIGFERLRVGGTSEAADAALAQAVKDKKDGAAALQQAGSHTDSQSLHVEFKGLKFAANEAHTDKNFTRAADLALPDADKQQIERERGFDRKDMSLHFDAIKGVSVDGYSYHAENPTDKLLHDIVKKSLILTPNKTLSFTVSAERDTTGSENGAAAGVAGSAGSKMDGKTLAGSEHRLLAMKDLLSKTAVLNAQRDETRLLDKGQVTQTTITDALTLGMPKDKLGAGLDYSAKRIAFQNGKYDNTVEFNIHAKPTSALTLQVGRRDLDRLVDDKDTKPEDKKDGLVSTDSVELDFQAAKNFSVILGGSQTEVSDTPRIAKIDAADTTGASPDGDKKAGDKPALGLTNSDSLSVGFKTDPARNITIAAKFDEVHDEGKNTKDVADFSIGNAKPLTLGPLRELTVKAGYASLNDKRLLQNETMTGHAAWKMWKHEFLLDYGGYSKLDGKALTETTARTYSFKTDPAPQRWFHGSFLYKVRTLADGKDRLVRRFTADAALSKTTHFAYTYGILPEDDKGDMQPLETADVSLTRTLLPQTKLSLFYKLSSKQPTLLGKPDPTAVSWTRSAGVGFESALGTQAKWGLSLSRDSNGYGLFHDHSDRLRLSYERQLGSDNLVSLVTEFRTHDGKDTDGKDMHDEVRATLDLTRRF